MAQIKRYDENGAPTWKASATPTAKTGTSTLPAINSLGGSGLGSNATYDTGDGVKRSGYIKDGQTFTDPNYTQRVPVGSTVYAANGKTYRMGHGSGAPTPQTVVNTYNSDYDKIKADVLGAWEQAGSDAIDAKTRSALLAVNRSRGQVEDAYKQAGRDAYGAYLTATNPYGAAAQNRTALGLANSGLSESSHLALSSDYQNALTDASLARTAALRELSDSEKEINLNAQALAAEQAEARAQYLASLGMEAAAQSAALSQNAYTQAYNEGRDVKNDELTERQWNYTVDQDGKNLALQMLSAGFAPRNIADVLGIPQDQIDAYLAMVKSGYAASTAQNNAVVQGQKTGGGGTGGRYVTTGGGAEDYDAVYEDDIVLGNGSGSQSYSDYPSDVDINSVLALGFGPITYEALIQKAVDGEVEEYTENGKTKFRKKTKKNSNSNGFGLF